MGGRIWVTSEAGRGSQFRFVAAFGIQTRAPAETRPSAANLHDLRVLVVDDNATNRVILEELLRSWRMKPNRRRQRVCRARGAGRRPSIDRRAVRAGAHRCDDAGRRRLRARPADRGGRTALASAKVIMLTSSGVGPDGQGGGERAVAAQLTKPVKQSDLLDAILTAFGAPDPLAGQTISRRCGLPATRRCRSSSPKTTHQPEAGLALLEQAGHDGDRGAQRARRP